MTTCIPRLAKGRPEFLLYPGNGHILIVIIGGAAVGVGVGLVVVRIDDENVHGVVGAVGVFMHFMEQ